MGWTDRVDTVLLDVDGTLVDSNYQHAMAWFRSFGQHGITLPLWTIHRAIGMGGDQLVAHLTDQAVEREHGDALRAGWAREFEPMVAEVRPLPDAHALLVALKQEGFAVVLASSGPDRHVQTFLDLVEGRDVVDAWTSSDDADRSKPEPDLLNVALGKVGTRRAVLVGDSEWDCAAARRAGLPCVAVRTGGFCADELYAAGAEQVVDTLGELRGLLTSAGSGPG